MCIRDSYEGTYGGQSSTNDIYINVDSSYDQKRIMNAIDPVSYTHLDVYKRQLLIDTREDS